MCVAGDALSGFLRLFVAVAVPPAVQQEIARAQSRLRRLTPPGCIRWTNPRQFHLTLKFLGDVPAVQLPVLRESIAAVCANCPSLQLNAAGVGYFPNERKPRVMWVAVRDMEGRLPELHRRLDEALRCFASGEKSEPFSGHVTLGRFRPGGGRAMSNWRERARELHNRAYGNWTASQVELVRSELTSTGASHRTLVTSPLAGQMAGSI